MNIQAQINSEATLTLTLTAETSRTGPMVKPVALCAAIDQSTSMEGHPLDGAKAAALEMIRHLHDAHLFSLVVHGDEARVVAPLERPERREEVMFRVTGIRPNGASNLIGGWLMGRDELSRAPAGMARKLLLLSDGCPTLGITDPAALRSIVEQGLRRDSIRTSCLGFGRECDWGLLRTLAESGGGNFWESSDPESLPATLEAELGGLKPASAINVRVRLKRLDACSAIFPNLTGCPQLELPDGSIQLAVGDLVSGERSRLVILPELIELPLLPDGTPVATFEGDPLLEMEVLWDEIDDRRIVARRHLQTLRFAEAQNPDEVRRFERLVAELDSPASAPKKARATRRRRPSPGARDSLNARREERAPDP